MKTFGDLALFPKQVRLVAVVDDPHRIGVRGSNKTGVLILEGQPLIYIPVETARLLLAHFGGSDHASLAGSS